MYRHAAKSAAQLNSSLNAPSVASRSCRERNGGYSEPPFYGASAVTRMAALWANLRRRDREDDFGALGSLPPRIPSSARGHASGPNRRPAARRRSASLAAPFQGLGSSQKKFENRGKEHRANFFRAPPRKHSLALGSRALSLALPCVTRAGYGNFNETENTTMYQNKVTLIGFLGNDAEVRTNNDRSLTTLSLATKRESGEDRKSTRLNSSHT